MFDDIVLENELRLENKVEIFISLIFPSFDFLHRQCLLNVTQCKIY